MNGSDLRKCCQYLLIFSRMGAGSDNYRSPITGLTQLGCTGTKLIIQSEIKFDAAGHLQTLGREAKLSKTICISLRLAGRSRQLLQHRAGERANP